MNEFVNEYLRSTEADSVITVFNIENETVERNELTCKECINHQFENGYAYYGKKFYYFQGTDEYDWEIYRAPKFDFSKRELLGEYMEILLVSPNGKYILGKKYLQGKDVAVILDTEAKKFDCLLGRDYLKYKHFYSPAYEQFAFDTEEFIIYIDFPETFSFHSTGEDANRISTSKDEIAKFWQKYRYPEL